jgi:lactobin A/cerein 7B family class IIb bacteriocin
MNLEKFNLVELDAQEIRETEGGLIPVAVVAWWAGASLLAKCGVVAAGVTCAAGGYALGHYTGYFNVKK